MHSNVFITPAEERGISVKILLKIRVKSHLEFSMFAAHSWPRQSCTSHQPSHADTDTRDRDTFNILLTLIIFP